MTHIVCKQLEYFADSALYFDAIIHLGLHHPVFLDSSRFAQPTATTTPSAQTSDQTNRYDILSAQPQQWLEIDASQAATALGDISDFFDQHSQTLSVEQEFEHLPFCGGIIANFSYELGQLSTGQAINVKDIEPLTLFCAGVYSWAIVQDHETQTAYFVSFPDQLENNIATKHQILQQMSSKPTKTKQFEISSPIQSLISEAQYNAAFEQVQEYILAGDCYQVNFAQKYQGAFSGCTWQAYKKLRQAAKAPFSAYWQCDKQDILCASPERFLLMHKDFIETKPIKGTRPRSQDPVEDQALAEALSKSIKDCAENLMIVDLLRNDLGKNCVPGSIKVDDLFKVESFTTVHHLVSTISGKLLADHSHLQTFLDCFPGGSITGAPKIRSMQIIDELEQQSRQLYCGSIAYFSAHGKTDSNICIRTFICEDEKIQTWAGGGIVYDSDQQKEYAECGYKIDRLISSLN